MFSDFCFVLRTLRSNRVFTLVVVLTLALGIGSAGAIFRVTDWILFRATRRDLAGLVLRRGVGLAGIGFLVGLGGAMALTRLLRSLLFEISPYDAEVLGAIGLIILIASVAACLVPASRATRVDISRLLRSE